MFSVYFYIKDSYKKSLNLNVPAGQIMKCIEIKKVSLFISSFIFSELPELSEILADDSVKGLLAQGEGDSQNVLKQVFQSLMTANREAIASSLNKFLTRMEKEGKNI